MVLLHIFVTFLLVLKPAWSSSPRLSDMEQPQTKHGFLHTTITKAISTLNTLFENHLEFIVYEHAELIALDQEIQTMLNDVDVEADVATAFEYDQKVSFAKSVVRRTTQSHPPTLPISFTLTTRPFVAPLTSPPQHIAICALPCLSTLAPTFSCVIQPMVS